MMQLFWVDSRIHSCYNTSINSGGFVAAQIVNMSADRQKTTL